MVERVRVANTSILHEAIEDEVLVINVETATYFRLSDAGAAVWRAVEENATVDEIVEGVVRRYQGAREAIEQAVRGLLAELSAEALIVLEPAPAPALASGGASAMASVQLPFFPPRLEKFVDLTQLMSS